MRWDVNVVHDAYDLHLHEVTQLAGNMPLLNEIGPLYAGGHIQAALPEYVHVRIENCEVAFDE